MTQAKRYAWFPLTTSRRLYRVNKTDTSDAEAICEASWRVGVLFVPIKSLP